MTDKTKIYSAITDNISISVLPKYEAEESNPAIGKFIYSYQVTMENLGPKTVMLLSRHWFIVDSIQEKREVKGEGVIGQKPELSPGDIFQYMSWCPLHSPIGKMFGYFTFVNLADKSTFTVEIPEFLLVSDFKLN
ncbi:MAG: Co2+/Mg2+ efflux protein ApaG [Saprospiraceae bacterium]|nr:Co2+/Mg2+ efflux protein ApaG [Saprospiraceae bacterium]MBK8668341.1 Co2+/Mg2+ efflux protein ApaG [Saprospiraceae bacterium]MBL0099170.1 Co2+/Mg2+ efflux protein ApaG [Saprospiraceae bacterium]